MRIAITTLHPGLRTRAAFLVAKASEYRLPWRWEAIIAVAVLVCTIALVIQFQSSGPESNGGVVKWETDADIANLRSFAASIEVSPDAAREPQASASLPDVETLIERLALRLQNTPEDSEGWRMLGWSYFHTDRFEMAVDAYAKAWALQPKASELGASLAEAMIVRDGGTVSDASRAVLASVLNLDPTMPIARFYFALAKSQRGQPAEALADMRALAGAVHDEASPWVAQLTAQIQALSAAMPRGAPAQPSR